MLQTSSRFPDQHVPAVQMCIRDSSRTVLLELAYGSPANVDRDVDLFEGFYLAHCAEEALARMVQRTKRRSLALGACLCVAACLLAVPMAMNPSSIFAVILLLMGGGLSLIHI